VKARDTPLADGELIDGACSMALCIDAAPGEFGLSSVLICRLWPDLLFVLFRLEVGC
jgi:hypothetical protein